MKATIEKLLKRNGTAPETESWLTAGIPAPDFYLAATNSDRIRLSHYRGRPVILAFYPQNGTTVCSDQLALYNEALHLFQEYEAQLLAISVDDLASHQDFSETLKLRFPLLADDNPAGAVASRYGVLNPGDGKSERALFVIDREGMIIWSELSPRGVNPGAHGILQALESIA